MKWNSAMEKIYHSSSEFVSAGHPDRLADNIAAVLIDKVQHNDGWKSHAAVEVFLTHTHCIFSGEVTTSLPLTGDLLRECLTEGFRLSGYLPSARRYWTKAQLALPEDLQIINLISPQSPDIAQGTTDLSEESGWNDQGIMFSSAENTNEYRQGFAMFLAQELSDALLQQSKESIELCDRTGINLDGVIGPDNKVVITISTAEDGMTPLAITSVVVAAPTTERNVEEGKQHISSTVNNLLEKWHNRYNISINAVDVVINGTGKFVQHGCISDTSMTGRKISVNHPSAGPVWCNKMIGGGSLVKPFHASDFILNVACRYVANVCVASGLTKYAVVGVSCGIGMTKLQSMFITMDPSVPVATNEKVVAFFQDKSIAPFHWNVNSIVNFFGILNDNFSMARCVNDNFFCNPETQPWEEKSRIKAAAEDLLRYLAEA